MTKSNTYRLSNYWLLTPALGALIFVILYVTATWFYPGGSQADKAARGFSWIHNYWCNLLNENGVNGEPNGARRIALVAMVVLNLTMACFAYIFPKEVPFSRNVRVLIQGTGIGSMIFAMFIFTELHDVLINVACALGLVSMVGVMVGLRKLKWAILFWMGILNAALVGLNNLLYYNKEWIYMLPLVQKITFLMFLGWVVWISLKMYKRKLFGENHEKRR